MRLSKMEFVEAFPFNLLFSSHMSLLIQGECINQGSIDRASAHVCFWISVRIEIVVMASRNKVSPSLCQSFTN